MDSVYGDSIPVVMSGKDLAMLHELLSITSTMTSVLDDIVQEQDEREPAALLRERNLKDQRENATRAKHADEHSNLDEIFSTAVHGSVSGRGGAHDREEKPKPKRKSSMNGEGRHPVFTGNGEEADPRGAKGKEAKAKEVSTNPVCFPSPLIAPPTPRRKLRQMPLPLQDKREQEQQRREADLARKTEEFKAQEKVRARERLSGGEKEKSPRKERERERLAKMRARDSERERERRARDVDEARARLDDSPSTPGSPDSPFRVKEEDLADLFGIPREENLERSAEGKAPPARLSLAQIDGFSVGQLKSYLSSFGVSIVGVTEKAELIALANRAGEGSSCGGDGGAAPTPKEQKKNDEGDTRRDVASLQRERRLREQKERAAKEAFGVVRCDEQGLNRWSTGGDIRV